MEQDGHLWPVWESWGKRHCFLSFRKEFYAVCRSVLSDSSLYCASRLRNCKLGLCEGWCEVAQGRAAAPHESHCSGTRCLLVWSTFPADGFERKQLTRCSELLLGQSRAVCFPRRCLSKVCISNTHSTYGRQLLAGTAPAPASPGARITAYLQCLMHFTSHMGRPLPVLPLCCSCVLQSTTVSVESSLGKGRKSSAWKRMHKALTSLKLPHFIGVVTLFWTKVISL